MNQIAVLNKLTSKKVIFFGAGSRGAELLAKLPVDVAFFVDNLQGGQGKTINGIPVLPPKELSAIDKDAFYILITSTYSQAISDQLRELGFERGIHFSDSDSLTSILATFGQKTLSPSEFRHAIQSYAEDEIQTERCLDILKTLVTHFQAQRVDLPALLENSSGPCPICGAGTSATIETHHHSWQYCQQCDSALSHAKNQLEDPQAIYDFFIDPKKVQYDQEMGRRYIPLLQQVLGDLGGRHVLDVSGGSGGFVQALRDAGAVPYLTEFNANSVAFAREKLGVAAQQFDFNADSIDRLFENTFDVVLLRAAIMFCLDVPQFIRDLKDILKPGALVFYESIGPTLSSIIRSQSDNYSYLALYSSRYLIEKHADAGFTLLDHQTQKRTIGDEPVHGFREDFLRRGILYGFPAALILNKTTLDNVTDQMVFRLNP